MDGSEELPVGANDSFPFCAGARDEAAKGMVRRPLGNHGPDLTWLRKPQWPAFMEEQAVSAKGL